VLGLSTYVGTGATPNPQHSGFSYKETRVRVELVDPSFEALGWDVRNVRGYAEQYKDVVHEGAIKVSGATHAPDYCLRIGGTREFSLEVKRPSVAIRQDVGPAYQLRRYAWSAKRPRIVLTDLEEFAVYDCRQRPRPKGRAGVGRVMYLTFEEILMATGRLQVLDSSCNVTLWIPLDKLLKRGIVCSGYLV
jgi:hypothetical protein